MPLAERLNSNAINLGSLILFLRLKDVQDLPEVGQTGVVLQSLRERLCALVSDAVAPHSATNSY